MGKKVKGGATHRAKKRAKVAQLDLIEGTAHHVETGHITSKTNKDLFVLDTTAALIPKDQEPKKKSTTLSKPRVVDEKVQALLYKHDAATLQKMANPKKRKADAPAFDLWEQKEEDEAPIVKRMAGVAPPHIHQKANSRAAAPAKKQPQVAIDVAQSGQSYHPDPQEHQNVIGEALALELRRQEAEEYKNTPISTGMSDETRALLMGDDDEEEESSDDEDEDTPTVLHKQKEKLTRAQRNRQKRIRAEQKELHERKTAKKRMNAISQAKKLSKELAKQQEQNQQRKAQLALLKKEQARTPGKGVLQHVSEKNPIHAPTLPVALSDDLSGTLRTMKPKGSLLTDRMESFRDRNMATKKLVGDRKRIVQGNKRRKVKVKVSKKQDIHVRDERGKDYLLMG